MKKYAAGQSSKDWLTLRRLFEAAGIRQQAFGVPVFLAVLAIIFEAATIVLLMPLLKGIVERDYGFIYRNPHFSAVLQSFHFSQGETPQKYLLILLVVSVFAAAMLKNIFQYLSMVSIDNLAFRFNHELRVKLFSRLSYMGKAYFDQVSLGSVLNGLSNSILEIILSIRVGNKDLTAILMAVPYLLIMLSISWQLTFVGLILAPFFAQGVAGVVDRIRDRSRIYAKCQNDFLAQTSNVLMNIGLVKAFRTEDVERKKFKQLSFQAAKARFEVEKKQDLVPAIHEMSTLVALLILMSVMAFMVYYEKHQDVSRLLIFFYTLKRCLNSAGAVSHLRASMSKMSGPLHEVDSLLFGPEDMYEKEGSLSCQGFNRSIVFKQVRFFYKNGAEALKGVDLVFEKGKCTALVGASGSGKTSVVSLLLRLYEPQEGRIELDGVDIRELSLDDLRGCFALVSQETFLFNDTIRNNVLYGIKRKDVSEELLQEVLRKARLDEVVRALPQGLDTVIGDRGTKLSGGEKQRLAIARAILRGSPVLIFDEATSALDSVTEKKIQEAIAEASSGKTSIVIAHRLSTIKKADNIIVLEKGAVVEEGSFEQLIGNRKHFYSYWNEQSTAVH